MLLFSAFSPNSCLSKHPALELCQPQGRCFYACRDSHWSLRDFGRNHFSGSVLGAVAWYLQVSFPTQP